MNFGYAPYNFELIYRPLYEMRICLCWCLCAVLTLYVGGTRMELPDGIVRMQCGVCLGMALVFFVKGFGVWQMQRRLFGAKLEFVPLDKFIVKTRPYVQEDKFWLGEGFDWTPEQTQRCYEILKLRWAEISRYEPLHSQLVRRLDSAAKATSRCGEILREKGGTMSHAPLRIPAQCAAAVAGFLPIATKTPSAFNSIFLPSKSSTSKPSNFSSPKILVGLLFITSSMFFFSRTFSSKAASALNSLRRCTTTTFLAISDKYKAL